MAFVTAFGPGASEGVPPSRTSDQESPEEEKVVVARRNDQQVSGDTRARAREREELFADTPGPRFSFWARPSLFRPPFFKYYARRGASMIAPSLPIASTGQPSIASWQSASSSG